MTVTFGRMVALALLWGNLATLQALDAPNGYPIAVTVDAAGGIYYADAAIQQVFTVSNGAKKLVVRGNGKPRTALYAIAALAVDSKGVLLVADTGTCDVYRIAPNGTVSSITASQLNQPRGLAALPSGEIFVSDLGDNALYRIDGGKPIQVARVDSPSGMAVDKDGSFVVLSRGTNSLYRVTTNGQVTPLVKGRKLGFPHGVVVGKNGNYLVSDGYGHCIWNVTPQGDVSNWIRSEVIKSPEGLALEKNGDLLVADPHANALFRVSQSKTVSPVIGEP